MSATYRYYGFVIIPVARKMRGSHGSSSAFAGWSFFEKKNVLRAK